MSEDLKITTVGIKKTLAGVTREQAIAEYIWNGFDAGATIVELNAVPISSGFDTLDHLTIRDNGEGIPFGGLKQKFGPYLESLKAFRKASVKNSLIQGQEGKGRLTFYHFSHTATWETTFVEKGRRTAYSIKIEADHLDKYDPTQPRDVTQANGTCVTFLGIHPDFTLREIENAIVPHLTNEFGWYLKLNETNGKRILVNGEPLNYHSTIADSVSVPLRHDESGTTFQVDFIQWKTRMDEYSKVYFLDQQHNEKFKLNSHFNNKGDQFYHSVYVTSPLFQQLVLSPADSSDEDSSDGALPFESNQRKAYRFLRDKVEELLKDKRRKFLKKSSGAFLASLYDAQVTPKFKDTQYDRLRKNDFEEVVKTVYETEPKFFADLSQPQQKTFLGFLNLLLDSEERSSVLDILDEVLKLTEQEKKDLCSILRVARLNQVVATLKLLTDRFAAVELIQKLVFNYELKADEVHDLQSAIEAHYWLFGEQYHLVTAAEPDFEEALRRHTYLLLGDASPTPIEHPDRRRQMDIFAVRQLVGDSIENLIVELKHPEIKLGEKELSQVKRYLGVIAEEPRFNDKAGIWRFYLVGNEYDRYIEREIQSNQMHQEPGLVQKYDNYRVYVKKWSEVFSDFKLRHRFLSEKLLTERSVLSGVDASNKPLIHTALAASAARSPSELVIKRE